MKEIKHKIGELEVFQKADNGYINATQLCKAYEKQTGIKKTPAHWFETNRANALLELVSTDIGILIAATKSIMFAK